MADGAYALAATGIVKWNTLPCPTLLSTQILPR
jgi:hypothetical protein